jgi:subtilase family serine protease
MFRKLGFAFFTIVLFVILLSSRSAAAQAQSGLHARVLVTQAVDEEKRVTLHGNTRPEARLENDRGAVPGDFRMEHMLLQLRRSPEQELALQRFIDELHTQGSPHFHQWISAEQFGEKYGVAKQDLDAVTAWLEKQGFQVNVVYPSGMVIDFSGTAAQVRRAFQTDIRHIEIKGERHTANNRDPRIPAALAPIIAGVVSLHNFQPRAMHRMHQPRPKFTFGGALGGSNYAVVPADLATIYNLNPLFSAGFTGGGQTIVLIEDTNLFADADWTTFRSTLGLSGYTSGSLTTVNPAPSSGPNNCANPGVVSPNDAEAILDAEWASAAAPDAAIQMAACADTATTFGGLIALQNLINSSSQPPAIVSISYGQCETVNGAAANQAYYSAYQQAVAEGVSVFVASGDSGAAGCDNSVAQATHGIGVNAFASTPYNVAVGGTDFSDSYAGTNDTYWNSTNTSTFGSARSYIPEIPWNDSCAGTLVSNFVGYSPTYGPDSLCNSLFGSLLSTTVAGGGGPSGCATGSPSPANSGIVSGTCQGWPKPSWQSVLGNPNDSVRDTPDISLFAADGLWGHFYVFCWSHTSQGGAACTGDPSNWSGAGGTSFSAPIMAGIQALINQKVGARQGNPNPAYYQIAAAEYGSSAGSSCNSSNGNTVPDSCVFYDVTLGDMDVNCTGSANCYLADAPEGVLSTSNSAFSPAYNATTGWDFATGIGTLNAANLVNHWPSASIQPVLSISKSHSGSFTQGQLNAAYSVTVSNAFNAGATTGTVTVTETMPSGLILVSMVGTGWTCSGNACSRSDALNPGASYPAITVTVNVASNATSPQVNQVDVSGGGSVNASATDPTTIIIPIPPAIATFVAADTSTQGNWRGVYGTNGFSVASSSQSIPGYASFAVQNKFDYVWASTSSDPRALQSASGSGRIASTWYRSGTFTFDVNITDGNLHQFALYAVDWDSSVRSESFQVLDANTNALLDTRTLSGFSNGVYLVWNLSGHVKINVLWTGGVNAVVSGAFFGGSSGGGTETVNVSPQNASLIASQQQQFTATVTGTANQAVTWTIDSVSPTTADPGSISAAGLYTAPATITPAQVTIKATSADGTASGTAQINLVPSAAANFVVADTSTQGNWHGVYGTDGYSIANDLQTIPAYATFAMQNQFAYTWASTTTDPRALQTGNGTGRIASTWYRSGTFSFDINLTDGNPHQFALYAVDWDSNGRTETFQVLDANTNAILDTRTLSSFSNGVYLVWNLSGHVKINVLWSTGVNAVVSGAFFGGIGGTTETVSVNPQTVNLTAGQHQQFAATVTGTSNQSVTWSIASVNPTTADPGTISATGLYTAPAIVTPAQVTIQATSADGTASGTAKVNLIAGSTATFVAADTVTQGNWHGVYGADGFSIVNDSQMLPAYASLAVQNAFNYTWALSTTDPRALQNGNNTDRLAATWYNSGTFTFDVNLTDGNPHQFALYAVDWDFNGRTQTVQIVDADTNAVLDTRSLSGFSNGVYLVWNLTGHVKVNVTWNSGINAVVSGVFFK